MFRDDLFNKDIALVRCVDIALNEFFSLVPTRGDYLDDFGENAPHPVFILIGNEFAVFQRKSCALLKLLGVHKALQRSNVEL